MLVNLSIIDDNIGLIELKNEKKLNALSNKMMEELQNIVSSINKNDGIKACILTGGNKCFSAGVDINEINAISSEEALHFLDEKWECISKINVPIIAAVSGYALGGGFELALMCDMIMASNKAEFGFPEIDLGLMPGNGGTQHLSRIVGKNIAFEMISTGCRISAKKALEMRIISQISSSDDNLLEETTSVIRKIASKPKNSLLAIKKALNSSLSMSILDGAVYERMLFRSLFSTNDKKLLVSDFIKNTKR